MYFLYVCYIDSECANGLPKLPLFKEAEVAAFHLRTDEIHMYSICRYVTFLKYIKLNEAQKY